MSGSVISPLSGTPGSPSWSAGGWESKIRSGKEEWTDGTSYVPVAGLPDDPPEMDTEVGLSIAVGSVVLEAPSTPDFPAGTQLVKASGGIVMDYT